MKVVLAFLISAWCLQSASSKADEDIKPVVYAGQTSAVCTAALSLARAEQAKRDFLKFDLEKTLKKPTLFTTEINLESIYKSSPHLNWKKLEIGASYDPLCEDCIYLEISAREAERTKKRFLFSDEVAKERIVLGDIRRLPFADRSLDVIIIRSFPWYEKTTKTANLINASLREVSRVLKDNGTVLILTEEGFARRRDRFDANVKPRLGEGDPGAYISEIGMHEKNIDGYTVTLSSYEEAFRIQNSPLVRAAKKVSFQSMWFRSPRYDGLILTRKQP